MPPPPPGPAGDVFWWILWLIGIGIVVALVVVIVEHVAKTLTPREEREPTRSKSLEEIMENLLNEMRLLRREIEELRRELRD